MRIPNHVHRAQPWRIHELVADFRLEDVWRLSGITGSSADFDDAIALAAEGDPAHSRSVPTRFLWQARDVLGRWFGLGSVSQHVDRTAGLPIPGSGGTTLRDRLPDDLRGTAEAVRFEHLPFVPLYRTAEEFAAEISNRTVHGVMHVGWVHQHDGVFQGQMAVYVKPRGAFGSAYLALIRPFRHLIVYPALERQLTTTWSNRRTSARPR